MLEALFGTSSVEKILFYLLINEKSYPSELKRKLGLQLFTVQRTLERLERGNILYCAKIGKTLVYQFNPRYPFLTELLSFLRKSYAFLPENIRRTSYENQDRSRPRRHGKPLLKQM